MGKTARFKKREIEIKDPSLKDGPPPFLAPELPKKENTPNLTLIPGDISSSNLDSVKVNCYHKINELFQNNSLNLFNLTKGILDIVCSSLGAEGGSLWMKKEDSTDLTCKVAIGPGAEKILNFTVSLGKGIVGWTAENRKSAIVYDTSIDQRFLDKDEKQKNNNIKTLIASPLIYNNEVIGVIEVVNKIPGSNHFYTDADKLFIEDLSTLIAMHVKVSRTMRDQETSLKRMNTIVEIHEKFSSSMDLDLLLQLALKKSIELTHAEVGSIWLVEEKGDGFECKYAEGPTKDKVQGIKLKKGTGIVGSVIATLKSIMVEDCTKDERFSKLVDSKIKFVTKSMLVSPFVVNGLCIGAIQVLNKKSPEGIFKKEDFDLLGLFAASSAMYLRNTQLFAAEKKAKELAALIDIGQQISSTLDIDSVLMSIVNLSSNVIPFDSASVSTPRGYGDQTPVLRAISGETTVDLENPKFKILSHIHKLVSEAKEMQIYVESIEKCPENFKELKEYLKEHQLESFWAKALKDDQGVVGIFAFESSKVDIAAHVQMEFVNLLTSQFTVALRNADLYNTIPTNSRYIQNFKENCKIKYEKFLKLSKKEQILVLAVASIAFVFLLFGKIPNNVNADVELLANKQTYFAESSGKVKTVEIKEGQRITKGMLLATLDTEDLEIDYKKKIYSRQKAKTEMLKLKHEGEIADYKIKESEYLSLDTEIELLDKKIHSSKIISNTDGVVISENLNDLIGMPVNFGQELIQVASNDSLIVQFKIDESHIDHVKPGMELAFKLYGHPTASFGKNLKIISLSGEAHQVLETDPTKYYLAKSMIKITEDQKNELRPGMTGRGKIHSSWSPIPMVIFKKIVAFLFMEVFF